MNDLLRPLASLAGKCEKAQRKLAPGSRPHVRMADSAFALRLASALLAGRSEASGSGADLARARDALANLIERTEAAPSFAEGTAPHTLLCNRLWALRAALAAVERARGPA